METEFGVVLVNIRRIHTIFNRIASIEGLRSAVLARDDCARVVYGTIYGMTKSPGCWDDRYMEASLERVGVEMQRRIRITVQYSDTKK